MEFKELRILVVEDNFEAMNLLKHMLASMGIAQVFTAKDGRDALDFLGMCDDLVDLVICDWNMPKLTGLELLQQLRTVDPDIPFMMVTGTSGHSNVLEAKTSGVSAYIVKPFSQDELEKKLRVFHRMLKTRSMASCPIWPFDASQNAALISLVRWLPVVDNGSSIRSNTVNARQFFRELTSWCIGKGRKQYTVRQPARIPFTSRK